MSESKEISEITCLKHSEEIICNSYNELPNLFQDINLLTKLITNLAKDKNEQKEIIKREWQHVLKNSLGYNPMYIEYICLMNNHINM